jgi:hypothetical protein
MTATELRDLNVALLPTDRVVRTQVRGAVTAYQLCNLVPVQELTDPVAFAAANGVTVSP